MAATDFLRPHPEASIDDTLEAVPPRIKRLLRSSFASLVNFDGEKRAAVVERTTSAVTGSYGFDEDSFAQDFGVTKEQAAHIANGATFLSALVSGFEGISTSELLDKLSQHELISSPDKEKLAGWLEYLRDHSGRFLAEIETSELTRRVLPTLAKLEMSVDIRMAESITSRPLAIPVVIAVVDTDAEGQIVWFQMSKTQLLKMQSQLAEVLKQFEHAEDIVAAIDKSAT